MKHTPGTWKIGPLRRIIAEETNTVIAQTFKDSPLLEGTSIPRSEAEANARLIAAAPELLEACEWAAKSIHHPACKVTKDGIDAGTNCTCHVEAARAAIAKAKGE